jgi:diamine N-acetyltransferase
MSVSLKKIDRNNWKECIALQVNDDQKTFVVANAFSLAEASFYPSYHALAVYSEKTMVGFTMYGRDPDDGLYCITRMMIDKKFQGKGYGKATLLEIIKRLKRKNDCRAIYISHMPENRIAGALYHSLGFQDTGEKKKGDIVKRLDLKKKKTK